MMKEEMMTTDDLLKGEDHMEPVNKRIALKLKSVAEDVSEISGTPWGVILGRSRFPEAAVPRMVMFAILANHSNKDPMFTPMSIARASNRDRATILHAHKRVRERYGLRGYEEMTRWIDELAVKHGHDAVTEEHRAAVAMQWLTEGGANT